MPLIDRAKAVMFRPKETWQTIAAENTAPAELYKSYIVPLAVIGPVATFIGLTIIGIPVPFVGTIRVPLMNGLTQALVTFLLVLAGVFVVASIVNALAPTFTGEKNARQALKLAAYAYTPALIAGIVLLFPVLGVLQILAAFYGLYLLYLGIPVLMKVPPDKALPYTGVVVACSFVLGLIVVSAVAAFNLSPAALALRYGNHDGNAVAVGAVTAGALAAMAEAAKQSDAASRNRASAPPNGASPDADAAAAAAAAVNVVSGFVSGGKKVETVDYHALQAMLPPPPAGMTRSRGTAERTAVGGIAVSHASVDYTDGQADSLSVEISDMGNASGVMSLGAIAMSATESESDSGFEKNVEIGGRKVHEKYTASGKVSEFSAMVGDRFLVEVKGRGVNIDTASKTMAAIDFNRLDGMKTQGAQH
ncbi:MAG: Yip1 family protein [Candidatus Velthaea sp.]